MGAFCASTAMGAPTSVRGGHSDRGARQSARGGCPSQIHQTAKRDNPPGASVENGAPLSVRIACGHAHSRKADSKTLHRTRERTCKTWQQSE
jgi:hypothetical protein